MKKNIIMTCLLIGVFSSLGNAATMISGHNFSKSLPSDIAEAVRPGTIVILGESHAAAGESNFDQQNQFEFIKLLQEKHSNVHIGMEFIKYTQQDKLDLYLKGELTEAQFLQAINWGGNPYSAYREQILSVLNYDGWVHALNAPKLLTNAISKKGLANLTQEEQSFMPPQFSLGSELYRQRFYEIMAGGHGAPPIENLFASQSMWDDTMAWKAIEKFRSNPQQIMVIITGNFHVRYGGGLPDRLKVRGHNKVLTIIQAASLELTEQEREQLAQPHPTYGIIGDYVW